MIGVLAIFALFVTNPDIPGEPCLVLYEPADQSVDWAGVEQTFTLYRLPGEGVWDPSKPEWLWGELYRLRVAESGADSAVFHIKAFLCERAREHRDNPNNGRPICLAHIYDAPVGEVGPNERIRLERSSLIQVRNVWMDTQIVHLQSPTLFLETGGELSFDCYPGALRG